MPTNWKVGFTRNYKQPRMKATKTRRIYKCVLFNLNFWSIFRNSTFLLISQAKIQKHQAFEAEVAAHSNAIVVLDNMGKEMISQNHFASDKIRERLGKLFTQYLSPCFSYILFIILARYRRATPPSMGNSISQTSWKRCQITSGSSFGAIPETMWRSDVLDKRQSNIFSLRRLCCLSWRRSIISHTYYRKHS